MADAAWPEGNEVDVGTRASRRTSGTTASSGRTRAIRCLAGRLVSAEVAAIERMPRSAARRPRRPANVVRPPATANQSTDRLAARDRTGSAAPITGNSRCATARNAARSARRTGPGARARILARRPIPSASPGPSGESDRPCGSTTAPALAWDIPVGARAGGAPCQRYGPDGGTRGHVLVARPPTSPHCAGPDPVRTAACRDTRPRSRTVATG
jgi:hypothetical protein